MDIERWELDQCVVSRFRRVAARYPHTAAFRWAGEDLSYDWLNRKTDRLAWEVLQRLGPSEEPVPFLLEPGPEVVLSILALLKAGKAYVALDPLAPSDYHREIVAQTEARLLLTHSEIKTPLDLPRLEVDFSAEGSLSEGLELRGDRLASLVFTSGSSGRPKGVERTHSALLHRAYLYRLDQGVGPGDRQALLAGAHFVASETDIFGTLLTGATLCIYPTPRPDPAHLSEWIEDEGITLIHPPVGFFRRFAAGLPGSGNFPRLRLIALGGEPVTRRDVELWKSKFHRGCRLVHRYSSSEAGNVSSLVVTAETPFLEGRLPAGEICPDKSVRISTEGEILVASRFLSRGYWREPSLTARTFVDGEVHTGDLGLLSEDGRLWHLGRRDSLVKVRGFRVDLGQVEALLLEHPEVAEAAVACEDGEVLRAFVVGGSPRELRRFLDGRLPPAAVPDTIEQVEFLPLSVNGKVDRRRLGRRDATSGTTLEEALRAIWERHLKTPVGLLDDFFKLGGTSLSAAGIVLDLERELQLRLDISVLGQVGTVKGLASLIGAGPDDSVLVPINPQGTQTPFFCVHPMHGQVLPFFRLSARLGPDQPFYGLRGRGVRPGERRHWSVEAMAEEYLGAVRRAQPSGPYRLGGRCVGGVVALEMAQRLVRQGEEVEMLLVMDVGAPRLVGTSYHNLVFRADQGLRWARFAAGGVRRVVAREDRSIPRELRIFWTRVFRSYLARPYPGVITVLAPRDRSHSSRWEPVAQGGLRVITVPGSHKTLLHEPYVRYVAREIKRALSGSARPQGSPVPA